MKTGWPISWFLMLINAEGLPKNGMANKKLTLSAGFEVLGQQRREQIHNIKCLLKHKGGMENSGILKALLWCHFQSSTAIRVD